uniref:Reverse transcriptase Ty1/copia-type domain-containing protein n=1 Tax=Solanum lycopersicum TaxID=4081 RepID=A0A3Q7G191_SOLLC
MDRNSLVTKAITEENDITALWIAKHPLKPRYKSPNAFCDHCNTKGPYYGNLSFSHNHNPASDINRSVGDNSHMGAHNHGHIGFHGSHASGSSRFNVTADMCTHGCGNTGTQSWSSGSDLVLILVYVDDLLIIGSCAQLFLATKLMLQTDFKIKDLGEMRYFLGLEIARNKDGIMVSQRKFALDLISDFGLVWIKPISTPLEKLVGKLLYLTMTRPDISYAVQNLSQFMHKPKKSHMEGALRVIKYLKNAPGFGVMLTSKVSKQLSVYCDVDWATCPITRRFVSGFVV